MLVCDVGGGTSDFSLIRVPRDGDQIDFTRTAVGKHLLLGGDNLDLTLAWLVETKLGEPLSIRQRSGLRRQCSAAKERLLCDPHLKSVEITVLGGGSSLIGGSLKTEITREEALELTLEGFLPSRERGEAPKEEKRSLFRELGLPYVSDPAITQHLNAFLEGAGQAPDAILFNGGFFIPEICRQRVADVVEHWYGKRPEIFENRDLDLAVATRRGLLFLRPLDRQRRAGSRRPAAHLLPRHRRASTPTRSRRLPGAARRRGRLDARNRSRRSATGREPAGLLPPLQLADPHRRSARARWWSSPRAMKACTRTRRSTP